MNKLGCLIILFSAFPFSVYSLNCTQPVEITLDHGLRALRMTTAELLEAAGEGYFEIDPAAYQSRADKIVYYPCGLTFWFLNDRTAQIRVDSAWSGSVGGISVGMSPAAVIEKCGIPWIEAEGSLYYNLPWQDSAVRIRFVFEEGRLKEAYLFKVL